VAARKLPETLSHYRHNVFFFLALISTPIYAPQLVKSTD
jgi:hypothetical protein